MSTDSPLKKLIVDSEEVDLNKLAALLETRVGIDPQRKRIVFQPGIKSKSTVKQLTALTLLGQKALSIESDDEEVVDGLTPGEIVEVTGVSGNSIRPQLKNLKDKGLVEKQEDGSYLVPVHALDNIREIFDFK